MIYFACALYAGDRKAKRESETPLRRLGTPDDIGGIAVMLASAAGRSSPGRRSWQMGVTVR